MHPLLRSVVAITLLACGSPAAAPEAPSPTAPQGASDASASSGAPTSPGASPSPDKLVVGFGGPPGWDQAPAGYIPPGSTTMPEASICPPDHSSFGCFTKVVGGTFDMGAQATDRNAPGYDPHARPDEGPVHKVTVGTFWMMQTEVLAQHFASCVHAKACSLDDVLHDTPVATYGAIDLPIGGVTWEGARAYCAAIGARLPTEAEWELATRGLEGRLFSQGNTPRCAGASMESGQDAEVMKVCAPVIEDLRASMRPAEFQAFVDRVGVELNADQKLTMCRRVINLPAAEKRSAIEASLLQTGTPEAPPECTATGPRQPGDVRLRTPEGIEGLSGNVAEWTADTYAAYPGHAPIQAAPDMYVTRGGSWLAESVWDWRGAARMPTSATVKLPDIGFRCVWSAP